MFERKETDEEIIIVQKPYFYYLFSAAIVCAIASNFFVEVQILQTVAVVLWIGLMVYMAINFKMITKTRMEVASAIKQGNIFVKGSKFSATNPFTYRIVK
jgi:multisubunit Na+/H+ antiporter MnhE subunit